MHVEPLDGDRIFLIHDLLTREECEALIARSEAVGYEAASVGGELVPGIRNNGRALVFDHLCLHEGAAVCRGRKYVLRTDVMYHFDKAEPRTTL